MNQKERVIAALDLKKPDSIPIFEWAFDKEIMQKIIGKPDPIELVDKLDLDGIVVRPDYKRELIDSSLYLDEWGCKKRKTGQFIDATVESPIKDIKEYKKYNFPNPNDDERFSSLENAVKKFQNSKAIILNIRDGFSDLRELLGYEQALISLVTDTDYVFQFLEICNEYNLALAEIAYKKFGVNIIVTTDDIADSRGLLFNPKYFFDFYGPGMRRFISRLKNNGFYYIKHCDGNIMQILDYLVLSRIDCIDPIDPTGMELSFIKKKYGKQICIKGNISCITTLVDGSLEDVENEVKECIKNAAYDGGYILSSSNSIHSGVNPDNFIKMIECARKYGKY